MRKIVLLLVSFLVTANNLYSQTDTIEPNRYVSKTTSLGVGGVKLLDTYLSPQDYSGTEVRFMTEKMRFTRFFGGKVSSQVLYQANLSYAKNHTEDNSAFSGLFNWNYALHYQFRFNDNFKILVGPACEFNGGFLYNLNNSNNPASAKLYANIDASSMAIYKFYLHRRMFTARYQINAPLIGLMFSPHYGESYYEIFTLKHNSNLIHITTPAIQPSLRQMLSLDVPVGSIKLRVTYICDLQQSRINELKVHTWSNIFMIGFVKDLYWLRPKNQQHLPDRLRPF